LTPDADSGKISRKAPGFSRGDSYNEREVKCRCHLEQVLMQELATKLSHRLRYGGFQEAKIPKPLGSAMLSYLTGVNFQDIIDVEEFRIQSASSFKPLR
jgi:hypothetical protein